MAVRLLGGSHGPLVDSPIKPPPIRDDSTPHQRGNVSGQVQQSRTRFAVPSRMLHLPVSWGASAGIWGDLADLGVRHAENSTFPQTRYVSNSFPALGQPFANPHRD